MSAHADNGQCRRPTDYAPMAMVAGAAADDDDAMPPARARWSRTEIAER